MSNLSRLLLVSSVLPGFVSGPALAQDPGSGSQEAPAAVEQPAAPSEPPSAFEIVATGGALAQAEAFLESKGWAKGWDIDKGWGVWIGVASLTAADPTGLALAMQDAQLDAKFQFAEYLGGVTESYTLRTSDKNPALRKAEMDKLSKLADQPGGDPVAANIRDLLASCPEEPDPSIAFKNRISTASRTAAQAAIPGMVTVATFVATNEDGLDGEAAVILISTPKSRQMADALLGRGPAPTGKPGMPLKEYVKTLSPEALVYSCGATYRMNEKGELCLLGFGVGPVDGSESDEVRFATDEARQAATSDLRSVAGELVEGSRLLMRVGEKTKWVDGKTKSESSRSASTRISTVAKGLKMPGVTDVHTVRVRHAVLGDLVCVVRAWNLSDAKNAATLREQFAAQGGWRGGEGVQPDRAPKGGNAVPPAQPRKPGVPSGSGGGGIDED
ncbi:MAG: hypothetical protein LW636_12640 [Planctomycetaceae bacterium]|nr:hypothetical protein [Planctomycetaceae bacterium]